MHGDPLPHFLPPLPPCRDAAALACTCAAAAAAYPRSKWPHKVRIGLNGAVREPASGIFDVVVAPGAVLPRWVFPPDALDVTVAPGEGVQAAVDRCPPGGCVLLLPGTHVGPLVLPADKEVHVLGRGRATLRLRTASCTETVSSEAAAATLDGLTIRREAGGGGEGVKITGGALRLQTCNITSEYGPCVRIGISADSVLVSCK